jgi:hypothetical protein
MIRRLGEEALAREKAFRIAVAFESDQNERTPFSLLKIEASERARKVVDSIHHEESVHEQKIRDYAAKEGISIAPK